MTSSPPDPPELDGRLVTTDRMAAMGVLAAGIAHELNNPLAYVTMTLQGLDARLTEGVDAETLRTELAEALRTALDGCERMRVILHDLLAFARKGRPSELTTVDLCSVIDAAVNMSQNEIHHRARLVRSYGTGVWVMGDETRLSQLFLNLLVNAAQAIPSGEADRNAIRISVESDGARAVVEVRDTGSGIAPEDLERIFEPFFTTKGETLGTGLGLAICRAIVEEHDGTIEVTSVPGSGTSLRVELPVSQGLVVPIAALSPSPPAALHARVLLVDDELRLAQVVREHVATVAPGVETVVVDGGRTALELLERDAAFDVIVCDLMMPRTTGMDVYEEIAARYPHLLPRFVVMTGGAFTDRAREFLDTPGLKVLYKPFTVDELLDAVERALSSDG